MVADAETEWDDRALCPDGACTGVLDDSGKCPACGTQGEVPVRTAVVQPDVVKPEVMVTPREGDVLADAVVLAVAGGTGSSSDDGFEPERALCADGACIGVIGDDGRCKVCGKSPG